MIYKKKWVKRKTYQVHGHYDHVFVGWFLFGFIPLLIHREGFSK